MEASSSTARTPPTTSAAPPGWPPRPLPFRGTETEGRYSASVLVAGGGFSGQAGAIPHGIARALLSAHPDARSALRGAGLLTRDPRAKERKKYGLKRARKGPQYTKR